MPAKRCPMCHRASEDRAWHCACGYEFGQPVERTRELLRDQLTNAKIMLGIFGGLDLAMMGGMVFAAMHGVFVSPGLALVLLTWLAARNIRKIRISRESLQLLAAKDLPAARVVR
jgi:hypothetical protein